MNERNERILEKMRPVVEKSIEEARDSRTGRTTFFAIANAVLVACAVYGYDLKEDTYWISDYASKLLEEEAAKRTGDLNDKIRGLVQELETIIPGDLSV